LYRTIYFPANPYGGEKELKEFFKQAMVYPDSALNNDLEGKVFITFLVNNQSKVVYKKVEGDADQLLKDEASRIFDYILWEKDESRNNNDIGYEKLEIDFNKKRYLKLAKKRDYHKLPYPEGLEIDYSPKTYGINELDQKPDITNASSVNDYVTKNFKFPDIALQKEISGRVVLELVIEPYGLATNISVVKAVAGGCNEEAIRLIRGMRWKPGMKNGKAVRTLYRYELNFVNPRSTMR
jgi:TonB family protein